MNIPYRHIFYLFILLFVISCGEDPIVPPDVKPDPKPDPEVPVTIGEGLTCEAGFIYAIASTNPSDASSSNNLNMIRSYGYVYKINNYPGATEPVYATLLVYKNQIIGGDVTDTAAQGKIRGFKMPEATTAPTAPSLPTETAATAPETTQ